MRARRVIKILKEGIPEDVACWKNESYGDYNVEPEKDIRRVLYCVTPTYPVVEYFKERGYDLLVCHHPYRVPVPQFIAHTALDCCAGGLNDQFRDALQIKEARHFDGTLGWYGKIDPISYPDLCRKVERFIRYPIVGQKHNTLPTIRSVVVCSGLGGSVNSKALATGADCYILGEAVSKAKDTGFQSMIETGHTHSEWIGVHHIRKLLNPVSIRVDCAPVGIDRYSDERYVPWQPRYQSNRFFSDWGEVA
jgi:putative NIF3 family GTP cyclohydrolase 1 type 2